MQRYFWLLTAPSRSIAYPLGTSYAAYNGPQPVSAYLCVQIFLVGTAHVSSNSAQEVRDVIRLVKPQTVMVELCQGRARQLMSGDQQEGFNFVQVCSRQPCCLFAQKGSTVSCWNNVVQVLRSYPDTSVMACCSERSLRQPMLQALASKLGVRGRGAGGSWTQLLAGAGMQGMLSSGIGG